MRLRTLVMQGGWEICKRCGARASFWPWSEEKKDNVCPKCGAPRGR